MSRFIDPRCGVPIFMMDNPRIARRCGRINGFFTAMSFTIFFIIGTVILTIQLNKKRLDVNGNVVDEDKDKKFVWWPIVTGIGCIIFSWIFFPFLTGYFYRVQYESKQIEKGRMRRRGLNEKEIYKQQQDLYEKRLESRSRIKAAEIQADAMRDAFRRR
tara:strand:- start:30 stop:506 length:477 start_codon:yes stop_codon:yes gene_type:complete